MSESAGMDPQNPIEKQRKDNRSVSGVSAVIGVILLVVWAVLVFAARINFVWLLLAAIVLFGMAVVLLFKRPGESDVAELRKDAAEAWRKGDTARSDELLAQADSLEAALGQKHDEGGQDSSDKTGDTQ